MEGSAQKILAITDGDDPKGGSDKIILKKDVLLEILKKVENLPVAVISIAGKSRSGKSFLLNFILQFVQQGWSADLQWMKNVDRQKGFHFENGITPVTKGIYMWSVPFIVQDDSGNKKAILLMDTQGLWDQDTSMAANKILCAVSSLASSVLLINIQKSFDEKHLESFSEMFDFGRQIMDEKRENPFQDLIFLIRDFDLDEDLTGWRGGKVVMDEFLLQTPKQSVDNHQNREKLKSCYPQSMCFLFPSPGIHVNKKSFAGQLAHLEGDFIDAVKSFISRLPDIVKIREIEGVPLTGKTFISTLDQLTTLMNQNSNMTARQLKLAYDTAQATQLIAACFDNFLTEVLKKEDLLLSKSEDMKSHQIQKEHSIIYSRETEKIRSLFTSDPRSTRVDNLEYNNMHGTPLSILENLISKRCKEGLDNKAFVHMIQWKKETEKAEQQAKRDQELRRQTFEQEMKKMEASNATKIRIAEMTQKAKDQELEWEKEKAQIETQNAQRLEELKLEGQQTLLKLEAQIRKDEGCVIV